MSRYFDFLPSFGTQVINTHTTSGSIFVFSIFGSMSNSLIDDWMFSGNGGFLLSVGNDTFNSFSTILRFWSSEAADPALRPELIIDFNAVGAPSSLSLLALFYRPLTSYSASRELNGGLSFWALHRIGAKGDPKNPVFQAGKLSTVSGGDLVRYQPPTERFQILRPARPCLALQ